MKSSIVLLAAAVFLFLPVNSPGQETRPAEKPVTRPESADRNRVYERNESLDRDRDRDRDRNSAERLTQATASASTSTSEMTSAVALTSQRIRLFDPEIESEVLDQDQKVISEALPRIKEHFTQQGLDETDAQEATLYAWMYLRIGANRLQATVSLTVDVLDDRVSDLGKVVIISDPADAQIDIGGQSYTDHTEARLWLTSGTYRIKLSKPGYLPVEDDCDVKKGKKTEFKRTLTPPP